MKKRLNILCLMVFVVVGISFIPVVYGIAIGFSAGFSADASGNSLNNIDRMVAGEQIVLTPSYLNDLAAGTIRNEVTGKETTIWPEHIIVDQAISYPAWYEWTNNICRLLTIVALLVIVVLFLKLIVRVNRGQVFEWSNVRLLRWLGCIELIASIVMTTLQIYGASIANEQFAVKGFVPDYFNYISTMELSVGLVALIVAEIFAVGLKMKEEQELTI